MTRQRLPIGIQSFARLRETGSYYVDKTPLIRDLVERGDHWFLSRPRRFGKSLLLDTIKALFEGREALFRGLAIHGHWDWSVPHPVVRLSFGGTCAAGQGGRTAGAGPTRAGATSRAGWTSPGARRRGRGGSGPATGRRTRINGAGTGGAVVSLVDRALRYTLLRRPGSRTAAAVGAAMTGLPGPHRGAVHTITADNGKEFADHARVSAALGAGFPCARPCHSRERGPTGHTNGLVRGYLPKGTDLRKVTDAEVRAVQDRTDARPRRVLGYLTPTERS